MTVKELLEAYDNWYGITKINNGNLECIIKDKTHIIADNDELTAKEVVGFDFIDNEFCIRTKEKAIEYVGNIVVYRECGKTKITHKNNYEAAIRNRYLVLEYNGTIEKAVEWVKQNYGGSKQ